MKYYDITVTTTNKNPDELMRWVKEIWKKDGRKLLDRSMDGRDICVDFERCFIYGATPNLRKRINGMATAMEFTYQEVETPANSICLR